MKRVFDHWKIYIFRGMLAVIPLFLSYIAIKIIYNMVDKPVTNLVFNYTGYKVYGLGLLCVVIILYLCGLITSNLIGRKFFQLIEAVSEKIPIIKTIYQVGKQVSEALSLPAKQAFKQVIFVELRPGFLTIGFVTGALEDTRNGHKVLKVFIPTAPNPMTGFVTFLKESQVIETGWTIEEGMKTVISGGIIGPEQFSSK